MIRRFLFTLITFSLLGVAQVQLEFDMGSTATFNRVLQLPNGDRLLVGSQWASSYTGLNNPPIQHSQIALAAVGSAPFNPYPGVAFPVLGGSGNDVPQAAAIDPSGNIWIVGNTDSDDFNLVNPIVAQKIPYGTAGFVLERAPNGALLFATYLAGQQRSPLTFSSYATYATAIAIDSGGNVYVGGTTDEPDFPTTPGAFSSGHGGTDAFGDAFFYSFLVKITPAGKLAYSTLVGTGTSDCIGGSGCIGQQSTSEGVSNLAVDSSGAATVAGLVGGAYNPGTGYVSRVAADGSKLLWTTTVPISYGAVRSLAMAQDASGNVDLFGQYAPVLVEPGFYQYYSLGTPGLFAAQMRSDGSGLAYSTDLGQSTDSSAIGIVLDTSGNPYLAGTSSSAQFPALAGIPNLGADFALRLDPTGGRAHTLFRFPHGAITAPPAFDASGNLLLLGAHASLLTVPPTYAFDTPAIVGFANSASLALDTGLYPGALVTLFGFDLTSSAQGLQVLIDGAQAPVLFAGPNQINVQAPFEMAQSYGVPQVQVTSPSGSVSALLPGAQSIGVFTTDGVYAAALNQDGTVNSASNPAPGGSIVSLFGTGVTWPDGMQDGAVPAAAAALDQETNKLEVFDSNGTPLSIIYAGTAPGLIDGVFQINVQLPPHVNPPLTLQAIRAGDTISSDSVKVYVK